MFCPRCGQQQVNNFAPFCSGCRFVMSGMDQVIREGGLNTKKPDDPNSVSPKMLGLKQGGIMFFSGIIIVPIIAILSEITNASEAFVAIAAMWFFLGGILRALYALLFQPHRQTPIEDAGFVTSLKSIFLGKRTEAVAELPPAQTMPADFQPASVNWRDTADLEYASRDENVTRPIKR